MTATSALDRARDFAQGYGLSAPILLAPMAGATPAPLAVAVAKGGGMGACGTLGMSPEAIAGWVREVRAGSNGAFQLNTWVPDPEPERNAGVEAAMRGFLAQWGPEVPEGAEDAPPPDFETTCAAMIAAGPAVISSIMGVYPPDVVAQMKARQIRWFATATTVAEARAAEAAGADVIVAQGMEAGGHRGAFESGDAERSLVGLFSLLPAVVDAVEVPVVATGGIADARGMAAALVLGASAVQIGTGFLRTPEAALPSVWADAIGDAAPEDTVTTRAFSGRLGRSIRTRYTDAATALTPPPYPVQMNMAAGMRNAAKAGNRLDGMSAWAGQSARLSQAASARDLVADIWEGAQALLR